MELQKNKWYQYYGRIVCYQGNNHGFGFDNNAFYEGMSVASMEPIWAFAPFDELMRRIKHHIEKNYPVNSIVSCLDGENQIAMPENPILSIVVGDDDKTRVLVLTNPKQIGKSKVCTIMKDGSWSNTVGEAIEELAKPVGGIMDSPEVKAHLTDLDKIHEKSLQNEVDRQDRNIAKIREGMYKAFYAGPTSKTDAMTIDILEIILKHRPEMAVTEAIHKSQLVVDAMRDPQSLDVCLKKSETKPEPTS